MTFIIWIYSLLLMMSSGQQEQQSQWAGISCCCSNSCFPDFNLGLFPVGEHGLDKITSTRNSAQPALPFRVRGQEYSTTSAELAIDGYTCSMCGLSVEKSLLTLRYIRTVKNDLNSNIMQVEFKHGAMVDPNEIARKVKESGFSLAAMTYRMSDSVEVQNNPIQINRVEFYFCPNDSVVKSTRLKVIGKNMMPKKEFQKLMSSRCELSAHTYWLQPL